MFYTLNNGIPEVRTGHKNLPDGVVEITEEEYLALITPTPEQVAAQEAEKVAFEAQQAADEQDRQDAKGMPFLNFLATHNNQQIRNRVATLAVDQAGIVDVLEKLAIAVAIQARKELR